MTNAHTKTLLANFFTLWQDPESPFTKWDFYGELFNMIEDKKITYDEAYEVTKEADSEWGQGIKVDILKMRVRDCRHGMTKTELIRRRKDRTSRQYCAWVKIVDAFQAMAETPWNLEEAEVFAALMAELKKKKSAACVRFQTGLDKWENHLSDEMGRKIKAKDAIWMEGGEAP